MKKMKIAITVFAALTIVLVLTGKSELGFDGFAIDYPYIDDLTGASSSANPAFVTYLWILLAIPLITVILVWLKWKFTPLIAIVLCVAAWIYHFFTLNFLKYGYSGYGIFEIIADLSPLILAVMCWIAIPKDRNARTLHCDCGYNMSSPGICPNCGKTVGTQIKN